MSRSPWSYEFPAILNLLSHLFAQVYSLANIPVFIGRDNRDAEHMQRKKTEKTPS